MKPLTALSEIAVPRPRPDETYATRMIDHDVSFTGLNALLGAAEVPKAGDRLAGLAARDEVEREAARAILSELPLQHLHDHPLVDDRGQVDSVMRVNHDVDLDAFASIADMTLGELKDHLLRGDGEEVARIGPALTGVMAAALAKLMDVHELILVARKVRPTGTRARPSDCPTRCPRGCSPTTPPTTSTA